MDTSGSLRRLIPVAILTSFAVFALSAQAASAAPTWQFGSPVITQIESCVVPGLAISGAIIKGGVDYDNANPPKAGDVFYVAATYEGTDTGCSLDAAWGDIALPAGTRTAIDAAHPIQCFQWTADAPNPVPDIADCVTGLWPAILGGSGSIAPRDTDGTSPALFDLSGAKGYLVAVPVVATASGVYDFAFPTQVFSTSATGSNQKMTVHQAVDVVAGSTPGPTTPTLSNFSVSKSAKLKSGVAVSFTLGAKSDVKLLLQIKSHRKTLTVGTWSSKSHAAGAVTAKVVVAKKYKKYFRAARTKASLVIKVSPAAGASVTKSSAVTIKR